MDSGSKRRKTSEEEEEEEDRISNLPPSLISYILSLLPTKYAVRTSALSTFWNPQWTSITKLRFDDALAPGTSSTPETKASFANFVYRVLLHLKVASPNVFQLKCSQDYGVTHINSWVSAALSWNVRQIDLSISMDVPGLLPRSLFSSRKLVVLKLGTGFLLKVPMLISLDRLKILHLAVRFSDNDSHFRLVSSCPVLEELKLQGLICSNVTTVRISSITLKRLILIGLNPSLEPQSHSYRVVLNTPCLQSFEHVDSRVPDFYSIRSICSLDRARIDVERDNDDLAFGDPVRHAHRSMAYLAAKISSIKFLYLSKDACKLLSWIPFYKVPIFSRLIELELGKTHWELLKAFLESSPKLATLSFQQSNEHADWELLPPRSVPLCMLSNLKKIEIKNFRGRKDELGVVRYFLEKSICLNKLLIGYSLKITEKEEGEISKKLLMLPRASTSCVVVAT